MNIHRLNTTLTDSIKISSKGSGGSSVSNYKYLRYKDLNEDVRLFAFSNLLPYSSSIKLKMDGTWSILPTAYVYQEFSNSLLTLLDSVSICLDLNLKFYSNGQIISMDTVINDSISESSYTLENLPFVDENTYYNEFD
jgi:hypothetical protein